METKLGFRLSYRMREVIRHMRSTGAILTYRHGFVFYEPESPAPGISTVVALRDRGLLQLNSTDSGTTWTLTETGLHTSL